MTTAIPLLLAPVQNNDDGIPWGLLVWVVIFFVLPMAGKVIAWVTEKLSSAGAEKRGARPAPRPQRVETRSEEREATPEFEERGIEAWHELSAGDEDPVATAPLPPSPSPPPVPQVAPIAPSAPAAVIDREDLPSATRANRDPLTPAMAALPRHLVSMQQDSLGEGAEALSTLERHRTPRNMRGRTSRRDRAEPAPGPQFLSRGGGADWRRAIVLNEVLGAPVALRRPDGAGGPPGLA